MHSTNSFGAKEIRKWNRPHTFNSSGLPYWPCVSNIRSPLAPGMQTTCIFSRAFTIHDRKGYRTLIQHCLSLTFHCLSAVFPLPFLDLPLPSTVCRWENTPSAGKAGYDPSKDPTLNPQITFKR